MQEQDREPVVTLCLLAALVDGERSPEETAQFERIVEGLARQLRSPLDRKLGRYAVTLPIFPNR